MMPEYADSAIGRLDVVEENGIRVAVVGKRKCCKCGTPLLAEKIPLRWTKVFVKECYSYCCNPCCPRSAGDSCPIALTELHLSED